MKNTTDPLGFEALDRCHVQIHENLARLAALARQIAVSGIDAQIEKQAGEIEAFFSGVAREHHAEEEKTVFPPLLDSGDAELIAAVRSLQQDHGWIEQDWIELAPQLRAVASGYHWVDPAEFEHALQVFIALCEGHIALEETLIYPESKARWAQALSQRVTRPAR